MDTTADYHELKNVSITFETDRALRLAWGTLHENKCWVPKSALRFDGRRMLCAAWAVQEKGIPRRRDGAYGCPDLIDQLTLATQITTDLDGNMPQQTAAIEHLHDRSVFALFMECRAGKTKTAIDLVTCHFDAGHIDRCLWIMPLSVQRTAEWQWQVFRQAQFPVMFFGSETLSSCKAARLQPMLDFINGGKCALIVDESHMFKNGLSRRFKRLEELAPRFPVRGILSGSPITQNVSDLYAQARLLDWRILGYQNYHAFKRNHLIMSDKYPGMVRDTMNVDRITKRLEPYVFDYFPKPSGQDTETTRYCCLSDEQRRAYENIKRILIDRMADHEEPGMEVYLMFTALQSVMAGCLSEQLQKRIYYPDTKPEDMPQLRPRVFASPKLELLIDTRAKIDSSVVIWCSRKHELASIAEAIPNCITVSGDDTPDERHAKIADFRKGAAGTLAAMLPVAKRGIDMYECDIAMFYGQSFDYESRIQAAARIKAPAVKTRPCTYYDLVYMDSLDEKILKSHGKKESIIGYFIKLLKADKQRALKELEGV